MTETFPPEVNGVSMTLGYLVHGLANQGYQVQVVRPYQTSDGNAKGAGENPFEELIMPGVPFTRL